MERQLKSFLPMCQSEWFGTLLAEEVAEHVNNKIKIYKL